MNDPDRYLYLFAYQTPRQREEAGKKGFAEESSAAVFIEASSPDQALAWGREISERFVAQLFEGSQITWGGKGFAHWIETEPRKEYPVDVLARVPVVTCGIFPDFKQLQA